MPNVLDHLVFYPVSPLDCRALVNYTSHAKKRKKNTALFFPESWNEGGQHVFCFNKSRILASKTEPLWGWQFGEKYLL